jgi:hypothetical protein
MFFPESTLRVHVYGEPVDMRKSFDGLYALVRHRLALDPLSGALFVCNRSLSGVLAISAESLEPNAVVGGRSVFSTAGG